MGNPPSDEGNSLFTKINKTNGEIKSIMKIHKEIKQKIKKLYKDGESYE